MTTLKKEIPLPSVDRPWLKYYTKEAVNAVYPEATIFEYLYETNAGYPRDIAILYGNAEITYARLFRQIDLCAQGLLALGVQKNDIVTIAMPSMPEAIYLVFALNRIGAVANMIHPLASAEETCFYLNETGSKVFLMFSGTYALMCNHLGKTKVEKAVVVSPAQSLHPILKWLYRLKNMGEKVQETDVVLSWNSFVKGGKGIALPEPQRAENDYAVISHTGGTTGQPKGCICTNMNIVANVFQAVAAISYARQECMMATLPPFINYSLVTAMILPLFCGLKTLLIPRYEPLDFVRYVNRYHVNHVSSIPAYWEALLRIPGIENNDFSRFGFLVSGGEHMDVGVERQINDLLKAAGSPVDLTKGVGMTELTSGITVTFPACNAYGGVGIPYPKTNCKVVDVATGDELSYGEEGELCFSGPTLMVGYYGNPEATGEVIRQDSAGIRWLHTGDIGYMTTDGIIFITGRLKRLIMQKDENGLVSKIFPERIEEVIAAHSAVAACCVVGIPDARRIALPKAFVETTMPVADEKQLEKEIIALCEASLPAYMIPAEVAVLPTLPRTSRGKIDYRALAGQ